MPLPPWLEPANPAQEWVRGATLGAQIAEERARLQMAREQQQTTNAIRQENLQRQAKYQEARIATENARLTAETGLREQRLAQLQTAAAQKTQAAAMKWAAQTGYARDIQQGMTHEQALYRHPEMITGPQSVFDAQKEDQNLGQMHLEMEKERTDIAHQRMLDEEERMHRGKGVTITYAPPGTPDYKASGSLEDMQAQFGTNLPPEFRPKTGSPFNEGQVIRSKKDNKVYKVINGAPVLQDSGDTANE